MRYWEYERLLSPEAFQKVFETLNYAVSLEPDCSQTLASLAILHCNLYNLGVDESVETLDKAVAYAEKAANISPGNQRVLGGLSYAHFTTGDIPGALHDANQALKLNPESLFVLDAIGWLLTLCGDWERGAFLAQRAIDLNTCHRAVAHDAVWLNLIRQKKYDLAYVEACSRKRYSTLFWDSLIRSSTCGLTGKFEEGERYLQYLLQLRPDFPINGKKLIANFVRFDELSGMIYTGLQRSGLES